MPHDHSKNEDVGHVGVFYLRDLEPAMPFKPLGGAVKIGIVRA
jgi:hypothetical protein